jgi:uncharacterized membrane protein
MNWNAVIVIFFRWLHIVTACIAFGGLFFMRIIVPIGLSSLDPETRKATFLRLRRVFKMVIHTAIVLFLVSGIYNTTLNWDAYSRNRAVMHGLWGMHLLLALVVFSIALYVLAGKEPPAAHRTYMATNLVLFVVIIALASTLKWVREHTPAPLTPPVATTSVATR